DTALPMDEKNCIQCRLCADNCPTSSIYIHESFLNGLRIALRESFSNKLQNSYKAEDNHH
ncbi:4Fe-4S binding protein, partial [Duncaniella muris]|uniref:4Fe-4S binding protein n=2 Tax=Bacteroidales TaxID=171549 RepID=UPI0025B57C44